MHKALPLFVAIFVAFMVLGFAGLGLRVVAQVPNSAVTVLPADGGAGFTVGGRTFAAAPSNPSAPALHSLGSSGSSHAAAPSGSQQPPLFVPSSKIRTNTPQGLCCMKIGYKPNTPLPETSL